jgi:RNA recognition motif-containing protein
LLVLNEAASDLAYLGQLSKKMMTAVGVPGATPISSYNYHHHLNGAMASNSNFVATAAAAAAAAAAHTNGSNASTGTTASSLCSTPVNIFGQNGLNAAAAQAIQLMQTGGIPYYPTAQLTSMTAPYGTTMATTASLTGGNSAFEGFPIVLLPQNGSSNLPLATFQKQLMAQQQIAAQPKIDTSKHFHLFVGDLSSEVDNTMLKNAFSKFGEISEVKVIRDSQSLKSRGYGFVTYPNKEHAELAIEKMNGQMVGRRAVRTNWAVRRTPEDEKKALSYEQIFNATPIDNTTVYIGNLNSNTTEENVRKSFSRFGEIKEIRMFAPQNYGFVTFETKDGATKAILEMSFEELDGQMLRCSWGRPAEPNNNTQLNQSSLLALSQLAGLTATQTPQIPVFGNPLYSTVYGPNLMPSWQ